MARLEWDKVGERFYETGVDRGVLFVMKDDGTYEKGVAWNGLRTVSENPEGAEPTDLWADNTKYATLISAETFKGSIGAYQSPEEFDACDGTAELVEGVTIGQQDRKRFGLAYRTKVGSDTGKEAYKIHIIYGASASPTERSHETVNDSPAAEELSWDFSTTPVNVAGHKPTATLVIDSRTVSATALKKIEDKLYGDEASGEPTIIMPDDIATLTAE